MCDASQQLCIPKVWLCGLLRKVKRIEGMNTSHHKNSTASEGLSVFYNGRCPICAAEIAHYEGVARKNGVTTLAFLEIHEPATVEQLSAFDLTPDLAARRLYAIKGDGLVSGVEAFALIWDRLPRFGWLATLARLPIIKQLLSLVYNRVAAPWLYRSHVKRQAKAG